MLGGLCWKVIRQCRQGCVRRVLLVELCWVDGVGKSYGSVGRPVLEGFCW